jgi:Tol biopolymer transport system component
MRRTGRERARTAAAAALLAIAAGTLGACRGRDEASRGTRPAPPAAAGPRVPWELAYEQEVGGNVDLYVIAASEGQPRRLTRDPADDTLPRWTPDGARIVFSSRRTGNWQIWEVAARGGEPRRLRTDDATEYQADVSPDGRTLAFLSNLDGPERLMLMTLATGATRELVRHGRRTIFGNPHWSRDGARIAFSSNWRIGHQIYVVTVADGKAERVSPLASGGCEPRFRPDGRRLAYVSRGHLGSTSRLVEHDLETGEERVLVDWPALNYDPVYSPDGSEIAFASDVTGTFAIYRERLSDGRAWRVTVGGGPARSPDYRPVP